MMWLTVDEIQLEMTDAEWFDLLTDCYVDEVAEDLDYTD